MEEKLSDEQEKYFIEKVVEGISSYAKKNSIFLLCAILSIFSFLFWLQISCPTDLEIYSDLKYIDKLLKEKPIDWDGPEFLLKKLSKNLLKLAME